MAWAAFLRLNRPVPRRRAALALTWTTVEGKRHDRNPESRSDSLLGGYGDTLPIPLSFVGFGPLFRGPRIAAGERGKAIQEGDDPSGRPIVSAPRSAAIAWIAAGVDKVAKPTVASLEQRRDPHEARLVARARLALVEPSRASGATVTHRSARACCGRRWRRKSPTTPTAACPY